MERVAVTRLLSYSHSICSTVAVLHSFLFHHCSYAVNLLRYSHSGAYSTSSTIMLIHLLSATQYSRYIKQNWKVRISCRKWEPLDYFQPCSEPIVVDTRVRRKVLLHQLRWINEAQDTYVYVYLDWLRTKILAQKMECKSLQFVEMYVCLILLFILLVTLWEQHRLTLQNTKHKKTFNRLRKRSPYLLPLFFNLSVLFVCTGTIS